MGSCSIVARMSCAKFIHFKCRNTKKLDKVAERLSVRGACDIVELKLINCIFHALINPLAFIKFKMEEPAYFYYKNNYTKTVLRVKFIKALWPLNVIYKLSFIIKTKLLSFYLDKTFQNHSFSQALIWGGAYLPQTLISELCRKYSKKTLYFEISSLPGKIQVDPNGINFMCSLSDDAKFYNEYDFEENLTLPSGIGFRANKVNYVQTVEKLPEDYIFVPLQVPSDSQILEFSPWIRSMMHFYDVLDQMTIENPGVNFIIKEHPSCRVSIQNKVKKNPSIHFANFMSTHDLIDNSRAVLTINSSVGMDGLILSKKVIVLGQANYDIEGLVLRARSLPQLSSILKTLDNWNYDKELRDSFLKYFYNKFLISGDYKEITASTLDDIMTRACQEHSL